MVWPRSWYFLCFAAFYFSIFAVVKQFADLTLTVFNELKWMNEINNGAVPSANGANDLFAMTLWAVKLMRQIESNGTYSESNSSKNVFLKSYSDPANAFFFRMMRKKIPLKGIFGSTEIDGKGEWWKVHDLLWFWAASPAKNIWFSFRRFRIQERYECMACESL